MSVPAFEDTLKIRSRTWFRRAREYRSLVHTHRERIALAGAALPALIGFVLLTAGAVGSDAQSNNPSLTIADGAPPAIYARPVCSFSNADSAAALVQGADGGASVVVGDRTYWLFGDTLFRPESGKQIEQNSIAWSSVANANGCPELVYYARDGIAVPFLPKDGSLTVWPVGEWPVDDHSFDFYTAYVYGSGPYAYWVGEVGVARLDTRTMQSTILARNLWDASTGFPDQVIGAQPVDVDSAGLLRVVLQTKSGGQLLARAEPARLGEADGYEFWDGGAWSRSPAQARPLWAHDLPPDPVQRLASFENGASIAYNAALHKYVALENVGIAAIGARTADRLEGPWSAPEPWLDCTMIAATAVPTCYSPFQHPELAGDDGRRVLVTFTRMASYDTMLFELRLGIAIHEYRDAHGHVGYGSVPPPTVDEWRDGGVVFYTSDVSLTGFVPIYRWERRGDSRYAADAPGPEFVRGDVAFYAAGSDVLATSAVHYRPVFDWSKGDTHLVSTEDRGLDQYGYQRGGIVFYVP